MPVFTSRIKSVFKQWIEKELLYCHKEFIETIVNTEDRENCCICLEDEPGVWVQLNPCGHKIHKIVTKKQKIINVHCVELK